MRYLKRNLTVAFLSFLTFIFCVSLSWAQGDVVQEKTENKAVKVAIIKTSVAQEVTGQQAPAGKAYFLLETEWENIHPKQKVEKRQLEGKPDRTMGVGGLRGGKTKKEDEEYVEADVAYLVPNFFDHAYILADGQTYSLDKLTEGAPDGFSLEKEFSLPKQGDKKKVRFVYLVPEEAKNIAFQFFDYSNGHILVPLKGDLKRAAASGPSAGRFLDQVSDDMVEIAATKISFQDDYKGEEAPEGWRYAVAALSGKSLSGGAGMKNIVQIEPEEYIWLATDEGYLYYGCGGSTTEDGYIRFTPEFRQNQEVAFLVPAKKEDFILGLRIQNRVYALQLGARKAPQIPAPLASHRDGKTMEVMFFGAKKEGGRVVLNLGIKSLVKSGLEIQADQQFILKVDEEDVYPDETLTQALSRRPPSPFFIPPQSFVRFELVYETDARPTALYFRGYESEKTFPVSF